VLWTDNHISLMPAEKREITATYRASGLGPESGRSKLVAGTWSSHAERREAFFQCGSMRWKRGPLRAAEKKAIVTKFRDWASFCSYASKSSCSSHLPTESACNRRRSGRCRGLGLIVRGLSVRGSISCAKLGKEQGCSPSPCSSP
jgi:hypothetical protein